MKGRKDPTPRQQQSKALARVAAAMNFKQCWCGSWTVFKAYNPQWTGWLHWCYTCGRKDEEVWVRPRCDEKEGEGASDKERFAAWWKALSKEEKKRILAQLAEAADRSPAIEPGVEPAEKEKL